MASSTSQPTATNVADDGWTTVVSKKRTSANKPVSKAPGRGRGRGRGGKGYNGPRPAAAEPAATTPVANSSGDEQKAVPSPPAVPTVPTWASIVKAAPRPSEDQKPETGSSQGPSPGYKLSLWDMSRKKNA